MNISAKRIERLLAERDMTKANLAERSGLCRQNISTIVRRGTCEPRTAYKLAKGLDVELDDILEEV